jgi:hypothetical protein
MVDAERKINMRLMQKWIVMAALTTVGAAWAAAVPAPVEAWKDPTPKAQYESAFQRLQSQFSLENVASNRIEVGWDDIRGMATPLSYRVPVQPCHHPNMVHVQPDLAIALDTPDQLGLGFAVGNPARLPDMWKITRKLHEGYLPMVESEWKTEDLVVSQTAFGLLPKDNAVLTGKEAHYVVVRMSIANTSKVAKQTPPFLLVGKLGDSHRAAYSSYLAPVSRWRTPPLGLELHGNALTKNDKVLLVFHSDAPVPATFQPTLDDQGVFSGTNKLTNGLRFDLQLQPRQTRTIDFVVAGTSALYPASEQAEMQRVAAGFNAALERAAAHWQSQLEPAMKLVTPDARINAIYKAIILSNLGMLLQSPDKPWHLPLQTPVAIPDDGVWSWEFAHMAEPMIAIGYHKELEPSLRYFTLRQNGVGPQSANAAPNGKVKSTKAATPAPRFSG